MKLGGGAVLAARWRHRQSHELDIVIPGEATLWELKPALDEMAEGLGSDGYEYHEGRDEYRARFLTEGQVQTLAIWAGSVAPPGAEATANICGREGVALSTSQILVTKLQRGEFALAKDVIDVVSAARVDKASLEAAVNTLTPPRARLIAATWDRAGTTIAWRASAEFSNQVIETRGLGPRGADAIVANLYEQIDVRVSDGHIELHTRTGGGTRRTHRWTPGEATDCAMRNGMVAAMRGMRMDAMGILGAAKAARAQRDADRHRERPARGELTRGRRGAAPSKRHHMTKADETPPPVQPTLDGMQQDWGDPAEPPRQQIGGGTQLPLFKRTPPVRREPAGTTGSPKGRGKLTRAEPARRGDKEET